MAASARAFFLSRVSDLSLSSLSSSSSQLTPPFSRHVIALPAVASRRRSAAVSCLISGVDGGGVSDEFVSTRKSGFGREFSVIANMLKKIEPLDKSVISKGVSDSAKDSMKQTISTMLGLLPSDQFSVTVRVSKRPLDRLLISSIITGYTLWNAEYRISLMRNFEISPATGKNLNSARDVSEVQCEESEGVDGETGINMFAEDSDRMSPRVFEDLSPEALKYIQQLESELSSAKKELNAQKWENLQIECHRENDNDLLKYLRSLEPNMVIELSRPSSSEVEEVVHQLVQNIVQNFFKDATATDVMGDLAIENSENGENDKLYDTISTSRDYLAKLLFWCMLLGHHLRGLENRLHLSCVVGLL